MTLTLFDLTYKACRALGAVTEGVATGGSATTIIDTVERTEEDDLWTLGTAWILRNANSPGNSPEGKYSVVSDYVQSTATLTLRNTLTDAVEAGDKYALGRRRYPLGLLIQKINEALVAMGTVPVTDITTIPSLDGSQSEYSLPLMAGMDLRRVYMSHRADPQDHEWVEVFDWDVQESGVAGTADKLIVPGPFYFTGTPIRLDYQGLHPELATATDKLLESVHPDRVTVEAAFLAALYRDQKIGGDDPSIAGTIRKLTIERDSLREIHPIRVEPVQAKGLIVKRRGVRYPGDQNPR